MALVDVAADDPHLVLIDDVAGGVPALPILSGAKRRIAEGIGFVEPPLLAISRTPHFVVANPRKVLLIAGVPAADEPHTAAEGQRPGAVARGTRRLPHHLVPSVRGDFLSKPRRCAHDCRSA